VPVRNRIKNQAVGSGSSEAHEGEPPQRPTPPDESMGERIRRMREQKDWSQAELARRMEMNRATLSQWENGRITGMRPVALIRLCHLLGCTPKYLVFGRNPPAWLK
jgi:ribosome-binding protein aMBF1 (putative translation factor)